MFTTFEGAQEKVKHLLSDRAYISRELDTISQDSDYADIEGRQSLESGLKAIDYDIKSIADEIKKKIEEFVEARNHLFDVAKIDPVYGKEALAQARKMEGHINEWSALLIEMGFDQMISWVSLFEE